MNEIGTTPVSMMQWWLFTKITLSKELGAIRYSIFASVILYQKFALIFFWDAIAYLHLEHQATQDYDYPK